MRGNSNHGFMSGSRFITEAVLKDYAIYDLGSFPAIKKRAGKSVLGEIYEVPDEDIGAIRRLEGEGWLYEERSVTCETNDKEVQCQAYVYLLPVKEAQRADGTKLWKYQA